MTQKPLYYAKALFSLTRNERDERKRKQTLARVLALLRRRNELRLLPGILKEYEKILLKYDANDEARIESAIPLSPSAKKTLLRALEIPAQTPVREFVDETLLGGARVTHKHILLDLSLKSALGRLRETMARA